MLRFCSKGAQEFCTPEKSVLQNEGAGNGRSVVADNQSLGTKIDLFQRTDELEQGDSSSQSSHKAHGSNSSQLDKVLSSGSSKKRSSSSGLILPKKKQASIATKGKISTPTNQRMISDFFKK